MGAMVVLSDSKMGEDYEPYFSSTYSLLFIPIADASKLGLLNTKVSNINSSNQCHAPTRKGRHVATAACPWMGLSFSRGHSRTRKASDIPAHLKTEYYPTKGILKFRKKYSNTLNSIENSAELHLKYRLPPAQEKQFIKFSSHSLNGNPIATSTLI